MLTSAQEAPGDWTGTSLVSRGEDSSAHRQPQVLEVGAVIRTVRSCPALSLQRLVTSGKVLNQMVLREYIISSDFYRHRHGVPPFLSHFLHLWNRGTGWVVWINLHVLVTGERGLEQELGQPRHCYLLSILPLLSVVCLSVIWAMRNLCKRGKLGDSN